MEHEFTAFLYHENVLWIAAFTLGGLAFALGPIAIVYLLMRRVQDQLASKGLEVELTDALKAWLAERGYDPQMGARPMARVIQEEIKKPLAEELLFGKLAKGGLVKVGVKDGKLDLRIEPPEARRIGSKKPPLLTAD